MMKSLQILAIFLILVSCTKKETETFTERKNENHSERLSEINLLLKNYNPAVHKNFISVKIVNAINPIEEQLKIADNGKVSYRFANSVKKELILNYEGREISLIVSPDEKINAELNIEELLSWSKLSDFKITGSNEETNNSILASTFFLEHLSVQSADDYNKDFSLDNISYKNKRISEMKNHISTFNDFIADNKIKDKSFINWAKAKIRYGIANDLSLFPTMGKTNLDLDDENEYFRFINDVKSDSDDELVYDSYLKYLENLTTAYIVIGNLNSKYKQKRELLLKSWPTSYFLQLEIIKKLPEGKDRDIMMAYLFQGEIRLSNYTGKEIPENYTDTLKRYTSETLASQLLQKKESNEASIETLLKEYDISQKEKNELLELYKETRGKVVFHDFWNIGCGPCMKELPHYNSLISSTNQNVVYIFYGVRMNEKDWKQTIEKFDLKGKHHLLTLNQLAFFEKHFGVYGLPHHQIINSKGQIVRRDIPRLRPEDIEFFKQLLEKYQIDKPLFGIF